MTDINLTEATFAKLDLRPGDVIVVRVTDENYKITAAIADDMRTRVRRALGDHEVIVLAAGLDLYAVRPEAVVRLPAGPEREVVRR